MVAAFGNFDVGGVARRRQHAGHGFVIQEHGAIGRGGCGTNLPFDGFDNALDLAGADDGVHLGNLLANLLAEALDQASGDHQSLRAAEFLVLGHFQNGIHRFLLRRFDEAAGIDHQHVGLAGARRQLVAVTRQNAHHHLAVDEVFGASQAEEPDLGQCRQRRTPSKTVILAHTVLVSCLGLGCHDHPGGLGPGWVLDIQQINDAYEGMPKDEMKYGS
jgi:hypothetical protein